MGEESTRHRPAKDGLVSIVESLTADYIDRAVVEQSLVPVHVARETSESILR